MPKEQSNDTTVMPTFTWTSESNPSFGGKNIADAKALLGIFEIEQRLAGLEDRALARPTIVPIQTLPSDDLVLTTAIFSVVDEEDGAFVASWHEANISTCGETVNEAVDALKELIVDVVRLHAAETRDNMGGPMQQQGEILAQFICPRSLEVTPKTSLGS